jgi:signal transduction histidine kinase/FixJ family two-component response regulator
MCKKTHFGKYKVMQASAEYEKDSNASMKTATKEEIATEVALQAIIDIMPMVAIVIDENLNIRESNGEALRMFEVPSTDALSNNFVDLSPMFQADGSSSKEKAKKLYHEAYNGGISHHEWIHLNTSGEIIPCDLTAIKFDVSGNNNVICFIRDMRKEKDMIKKLKETVAREQEASRAKTRFLTSMSHEIRTPMNAVMGISEMELQKGVHPPETEDAFLRIYNSSNLLLSIINDILDLSKVESGKLEVMPSIYETAELIVNTMQLNLMSFDNPDVKFELAVGKNLPVFMIGDELRIKQVLNNLLSNAVKYTKKGEIVLTFSVYQTIGKDRLMLQIKVSDTGQGMTKEQVDSLFVSEFTRFNSNENRNVQGSGLGLYITNRLVSMMGGEIYVESEKGIGSAFTVLLPQKIASDEVLGKQEAERLQDLNTVLKSFKSIKAIDYKPIPDGKVLIVDDVESNLYVAKEILKPYQLSIDTASDGNEVISKIQNGNVYDVIFMDHMMPVMDGIEATRLLRLMNYNAPIVALSANALRGAEEMFLESGFTDFVPKPIDTAHIEKILAKYVRHKNASEDTENETSTIGLEIFKVDAKLSDELVKYFLKDVDNAVDVIGSLLKSNTFDSVGLRNYIVRVHGLKNALNNVGETSLSKIAAELEQAGNSEDFTSIYGKTPQFLSDTLKVAQSLRSVESDDISSDTDENPQFVKEKLHMVRDACDNFDTEVAEKAVLEIDPATCSVQTKELLEALADHILCGEMDEAIERIDEWLEGR